MSATADLDGDGRAERVNLTLPKTGGQGAKVQLRIGELSVDIGAEVREELPEGVAIVDIDSRDRLKEVVVKCGSSNGGGGHLVYAYDGKTIFQLGGFWGPRFRGYGIVYDDCWTGSFLVRDKWVLDRKSREFRLVRQPMNYIGNVFKADSSFPIRYSMDDGSHVVANIEPKSQILIVALAYKPEKRKVIGSSDRYETIERQWYLIKSYTGLMGWASADTVGGHVPSLPMAG